MARQKNVYDAVVRITSEGGAKLTSELKMLSQMINNIGGGEKFGAIFARLSNELNALQKDIITKAAPREAIYQRYNTIINEINKISKDVNLKFYNEDTLKQDEANIAKLKNDIKQLEEQKKKLEETGTLEQVYSGKFRNRTYSSLNNDFEKFKKENERLYIENRLNKNPNLTREKAQQDYGNLKSTQALNAIGSIKDVESLNKATEYLEKNIKKLGKAGQTALRNIKAFITEAQEAVDENQKAVATTEQEITQNKEILAQKEKELELRKEIANSEEVREIRGINTNVGTQGRDFKMGTKTEDSYVLSEENQKKLNEETGETVAAFRALEEQQKKNEATADRLAKRYLSFYATFRVLKRVMKEVYNTIKQLDAAFNEIAVVTQYSTKEVWGMYDAFVSIANQTGKTAEEIIHVAGAYFKQGKSYQEVLELTKAASMAASVAGISAEESVRYLTAALNGYNLSAAKAMDVSDKFAKLAANSATNYEDLAIALSKVAAQASSSGVAMDSLLGFMTAALEVTQEAPENIGTAFKTILARMTNLTDYGKVLEDNTSANAVAKALNTINVALFDQEGQIRNLDDVLIEVGYQWENLDSVQQRYIATALAGTRQQTRLMAVFNDFERTMELVEISQDSAGTTLLQQSKRMEGLEYHLTQLKTAWQAFIADLGSADVIKGIVDSLTGIVKALTFIGSKTTMAIVSVGVLALNLGKIPAALDIAKGVLEGIKNSFKASSEFLKDIPLAMKQQNAMTSAIKSVTSLNRMQAEKLAIKIKESGIDQNGINQAIARLKYEKLITKEEQRQLQTEIQKKLHNEKIPEPTMGGGGFNLTSVGIMAAIAVLSLIISQIVNNIKKLKQETTDLYKEYNKNKDTSKNVQKLAKEYLVLQNTIGKTVDQMEQMEAIQQQIQDADPNANFIDAFGRLDEKQYEQYLKDLNNKNNETINKIYDNALERSKSTFAKIKKEYYKTEDELTKKALEMAQAIKLAGEDSEGFSKYAQYLEDGNKEATSLLNTIGKLSLKTIKVLDQEQYSSALLRAQGEDSFKDNQEAIEKNLRESYSSSKTVEEVLGEDTLKAFTNQLLEQGYNTGVDWIKKIFDGATQEQEVAIAELLKSLGGSYTSVAEIMQRFNKGWEEATDYIQGYINKGLNIDPFVAAVDKAGISSENFEKILNTIASDYDSLDELAGDGINNLAYNLKELGIGTQEIIPFVTELIHQFSNIPDIENSLNAIRNGTKNLQEFNSALQDGTFSYDQLVQYLMEYPELSENIINSILKTGSISEEVTNQMLAADKKEFEAAVQAKIDELEAEQIIIKSQLKIENDKLKALEDNNYQAYMSAVNAQEAELQAVLDSVSKQATAYQQLALYRKKLEDDPNAKFTIEIDADLTIEDFEKRRQELIKNSKLATKQLEAQLASNQAQIDALTVLQKKQDSIYGSATADANKASNAASEYERKLNDIYIIEQKLAALNKKMSLVDALESLYKGRDGLEYKYLFDRELEFIEEQTSLYEELIDAQKEEQEVLLQVTGSMNGAYTIINGRMVPVMDKYLQLTDDEAKALDEVAENYNKYSDSIADNTVNLVKNTEALKKMQEERRDSIIETQKVLIAAIKEEQKKIYEEEKNRLEKEKELLDKRKKMYQDAFEEEDYQNELADIEQRRQNVIDQLNKIAGANDAKSKEKRKSLLEELDSINKEYNDKTTEYNRNALLEQIDNEIEANSDEQKELQTNYDERINDYAWLEEQIINLTSQGVEACMEYLRKWHTDYQNGTTEMREKVEQEWQALFDSVYGQYDKNVLESAKMLSSIEAQNKATTDSLINMWNNVAAAQKSASSSGPTGPSGGGNKKWHFNGKTYSSEESAVAALTGWIMSQIGAGYGVIEGHGGYAQDQVKYFKNRKIQYYSNGGYVPYTGLAMVHGTTNSPEAFLSAKDTANFEALKLSLDRAYSKNDTVLGGDIIIQGINIETNQLNTEQDWYRSGKQFGTALQAALRERGLVSNIKK